MFRYLRRSVLLIAASVAPIGLHQAAAAAFNPDLAQLAAAKKEGSVLWYSSMVGISDDVAKLFQQETGIPVQIYNAVSGKVIAKVETERKAGVALADVVHHTSLYDMERWQKAGMVTQEKLPDPAVFAKGTVDPNGDWFGLRILTAGIAYNKTSIAPADVPKSWKDVLNSHFAGKIVYQSPSLDGMPQYTVKMLLDLYGWDYFQKLAALKPYMVQSDGNAITLVISGEEPVAGTIAAYNALNAAYNHQPIGIIFPSEGVPVSVAPVAVMKGAPHPAAAALFYQFLASEEVGNLLSRHGLLSGRLDVPAPKGQPPLSQIKPYYADLNWLAKNKKAMAEKFDDLIAQAR